MGLKLVGEAIKETCSKLKEYEEIQNFEFLELIEKYKLYNRNDYYEIKRGLMVFLKEKNKFCNIIIYSVDVEKIKQLCFLECGKNENKRRL